MDCNDKDMSQTTSDPTAASEERTGEDMSDQSDDDIEKSAPLSSFTWEAYELSSDWNKSLKGDHGMVLYRFFSDMWKPVAADQACVVLK